jgi:hypothetical protein
MYFPHTKAQTETTNIQEEFVLADQYYPTLKEIRVEKANHATIDTMGGRG